MTPSLNRRRRSGWTGGLAILATALLVAGCTNASTDIARATSEPRDGTTSGQGDDAAGELSWDDCENELADAAGLECATMEVPVDHGDPEGEQIELVLARSESTGTAEERIGSLLFNPGGPGGSGIDALANLSVGVPPELHDRFDLVSWDPRGVAGSSPVECLDDAGKDAEIEGDLSPDTPEEVEAAIADQERFRTACEENNPDLVVHMSTADVAADLDLIREALGDEKLNYVGYSYGTAIGAAYATMFPQNVRAMVLDGAVSPSKDDIQTSLEQVQGFEATFQKFVAACDADPACALSGGAAAKVTALQQRLDQTPLVVETASGPREMGRDLFDVGLATALYDTTLWGMTARAVANIDDGGGAVLLALADLQLGRNPDGTWENSGDAQVMVNCLDAAERPSTDEAIAESDRFRQASPTFGEDFAIAALTCVDWPVAANPTPEFTGAGAPPILVVGSVGDPATPYRWAEELTAALESAELLTYEGDGHTAFLQGKGTCVDDAVINYLVDLEMPPPGTRCPTEGGTVGFGSVKDVLLEQFETAGIPQQTADCIIDKLIAEVGESELELSLLQGDIEEQTALVSQFAMECMTGGN